ncbi:hypothetical protein ACFOYW_15320 [Gryllotalpicola reticulitermitis]|uniref:2TM domain-containing protein n=1 Tax=Gryllotalpicola reticulitermitis TaxID=1184153 RepID=A0ABV8QAP6_9MICO
MSTRAAAAITYAAFAVTLGLNIAALVTNAPWWAAAVLGFCWGLNLTNATRLTAIAREEARSRREYDAIMRRYDALLRAQRGTK